MNLLSRVPGVLWTSTGVVGSIPGVVWDDSGVVWTIPWDGLWTSTGVVGSMPGMVWRDMGIFSSIPGAMSDDYGGALIESRECMDEYRGSLIGTGVIWTIPRPELTGHGARAIAQIL
jgi:hypothetical protein